MPSNLKIYLYSPGDLENILENIADPQERATARRIIERFLESGNKVQIKHMFYDRPSAYYRVFCFVKGKGETVIINTKNDKGSSGVIDGMSVQLRILNKRVFKRLDSFSESVRSTILRASDCGYCSTSCEDRKRYSFKYGEKEYVKCRFLCSNFRFVRFGEEDVESIMELIEDNLFKDPRFVRAALKKA